MWSCPAGAAAGNGQQPQPQAQPQAQQQAQQQGPSLASLIPGNQVSAAC